jgi:hypothetical protein
VGHLVAENRILRSHFPARVRLTDPQGATLAAIGKRLGRQALESVALVAKPETILGWYRKLIAVWQNTETGVLRKNPTSTEMYDCHQVD